MRKKEVNFRIVTLINNNFGSKSSKNPVVLKIYSYFYRVFLKMTITMESNEANEEKKIQFQKPSKRRRWTGFPIWVWLLLLAVVVGLYIGLSLKYK